MLRETGAAFNLRRGSAAGPPGRPIPPGLSLTRAVW